MVGQEKCNTEGSHGASKHVELVAHPTLIQAVDYLKKPVQDGGCGCTSIMGLLNAAATGLSAVDATDGYPVRTGSDDNDGIVSIVAAGGDNDATANLPKSYPVHTNPFPEPERGNLCIVLNKSWKGLPLSLARACDFFLHVVHAPIVTTKPELLLDVPSCLSIVLHHVTQWAGYDERSFDGFKFQVAHVQRGRIETFLHDPKHKTAHRIESKEENERAAKQSVDALGNMFDELGDDYDY